MNNLMFIVINTMLQNLTQKPLQSAFEPYIALLGIVFYGFLVAGGTLIIYSNAQGNAKLIGSFIFAFLFLVIFSVVLNSLIMSVAGAITGLIAGWIVYKGFVAKEEQ